MNQIIILCCLIIQDAVLDRYTQYGNENQQQQAQPSAIVQADWVRNKHIGKKGEFRYF